MLLGGNTYRLGWFAPAEMFNGGTVTVTVANVFDPVGNAIGATDSGDGTGLGILPTVTGAMVVTSQSVDVTFSEPMLAPGLVTTPSQYMISGTGQGTLGVNPNNVVQITPTQYRCNWLAGSQAFGGNVTITVTVGGPTDLAGNPLTLPNAATDIGGGIPVELSTFTLE